MRENGIKRGVGGGRVGGWAERGKKQGWYRGKKVGSCGNCRGRGAGGRELCSLRTVVEGKAGVDRARRVNLSIRGSMGMREGGGGRMVQGPKGSKRRKIRPRSGRSMASEEGRSCDRPLQRAKCGCDSSRAKTVNEKLEKVLSRTLISRSTRDVSPLSCSSHPGSCRVKRKLEVREIRWIVHL